MCTLSWRVCGTGYQIFFNRDERLSRARAKPPTQQRSGSLAYLAPQDADAGGTWIAVNQRGMSLALLNYYSAEHQPGRQSRGLLIPQLIAYTASEVGNVLAQLPLTDFAPFSLVLAGGRKFEVARWDGKTLASFRPVAPPVTSSSVAENQAGLSRSATYASFSHDEQGHLAFHRSHLPERGPLSPCMHRADARTVSFTVISVAPDRVEMVYADGPPCSADLSAPQVLLPRAS
jgi:hypothetical protein